MKRSLYANSVPHVFAACGSSAVAANKYCPMCTAKAERLTCLGTGSQACMTSFVVRCCSVTIAPTQSVLLSTHSAALSPTHHHCPRHCLQDAKQRTVPVKVSHCSSDLGTLGAASGVCYATITNRPGGAPQLFLHSSAAGGVDYAKASGLGCSGQTPPRELHG